MAALKQVLLNHLIAREEAEKGKEVEKDQQRKGRDPGCLLRTNSLWGPENGSKAAPPSAVLSPESGPSESTEAGGKDGGTAEILTGDTVFFDTLAEDCGEGM